MPDRFQNFIDGRWVDAATKATSDDVNPANRSDVLGTVPRSDHRDVDRAVDGAAAAWRDWARQERWERAGVLRRAADLMQAKAGDLAALTTRESGKLLADSRAEVSAAVEILADVAEETVRDGGRASWTAAATRLSAPGPIGVVGVITPWSFPLALPAGLAAAALAAGNAVVLKPSEDTPILAARLVEIFLEAGLPPRLVCLVHGSGDETGAPLLRHPEVGLIAFAGLAEVAREVAIACAAEQKRALVLPQGREALMVLEDADLEPALAAAMAGTFAPTARRRPMLHLVVQGKAGREVQERLVDAAQGLRPGDGLLPDTSAPPLINDRQVKRLHAYVRVGIREGAKLLCGGETYREGECRKGFFYAPTVLADVQPKMRVAQDEVAGPVLDVLPVSGLEQAMEWTDRLPTGHAVTIYSRDVARALRVAAALDADTVRVNPSAHGTPGAREWVLGTSGSRGRLLDRFSRWRSLLVDYRTRGAIEPPARGEADKGPRP